MQIVNTDNFGGDYPAEYFLNCGRLPKISADKVAEILNNAWGEGAHNPRYWKVVADDYVLQPGFEP